MIMTKPRIREIDRSAGSFLHSSRLDPGQCNPAEAPPFLRVGANEEQPLDLTNHVKRAIDHLQLDALIVLGDQMALAYAARLSREGVAVIGIPKSVHNDIPGTSYSLGISTAIRRGVHFVREMRDVAASREEVAVISVLGHRSGLATMLISTFANADRTLIPEVPFEPGRLGELLLEDRQKNPSNYAILVMSENARFDPQQAPELIANLAADVVVAGRRGSGPMVTRVMEEVLGQHLLHQPLSYLTRTGEVDGWDLFAATNFGIIAVDLAAKSSHGRMVAYRPGESYIDVPLTEATQLFEVDVTEFYDADSYTVRPNIYTVGARRTLGL
jgi:6-phosphofructokinase 1